MPKKEVQCMAEQPNRDRPGKINSPQQLEDYIKVTNPSGWITLSAIAVLLCGLFCWILLGTIEEDIHAVSLTQGQETYCFLRAEEASQLEQHMVVRMGRLSGNVKEVSSDPLDYSDIISAYGDKARFLQLDVDGLYYCVTCSVPGAAAGVESVRIVVESLSPLSYILN